MSKVWLVILLTSIGALLFVAPANALSAMLKGSRDALNLAMQLVASYAFWLGFFSILEKTGISNKLAKLLSPVVRFLFPGTNKDAQKYITMNISANLLGLGNASTPMAIRAVNSMGKDGESKANINMIMLVVISSTSLQLLPTTVISMRDAHGSVNPTDFLPATIAATIISTVLGIIMVKLLWQFMKKKTRKSKSTTPKSLPLTPPSLGKKIGVSK